MMSAAPALKFGREPNIAARIPETAQFVNERWRQCCLADERMKALTSKPSLQTSRAVHIDDVFNVVRFFEPAR
jgi:hypothetical protein